MRIGLIGIGRMGNAMVLHLLEMGVEVVTFNRTKAKLEALQKEISNSPLSAEVYITYTIEDLVKQTESPKVIWVMVPQGGPVDEMIEKLLAAGVTSGDTIIDGGNSFYKDTIRRYKFLKEKGIKFLDVGVSGGLEGARNGSCLMIGGDEDAYKNLTPLFEALATKDGFAYMGPAGAGHFVKMVHNGVEYGMLQSLGEGFEILSKGPYNLDFEKIAKNWSNGSVVRGWLTELLERAFKTDPKLDGIEGVVGGGTTGKWTVETAKSFGVFTPVIEDSIKARENSQTKPNFAGKIVAALRREFGGHPTVIKK